MDYGPFREAAALLYDGPWLAERFAVLEKFLTERPQDMHPITAASSRKAASFGRWMSFEPLSAAGVARRLPGVVSNRRRCWSFRRCPRFRHWPRFRPIRWAGAGGWGTYTNFVNLLGLAALSVPAGFTPHGLPVGITLIGPGGSEGRLCEVGLAWQRELDLPLGATGQKLPARQTGVAESPAVAANQVRVVRRRCTSARPTVASGLVRFGARFVGACRTAARYRFMAFMDLAPPRPGLLRDRRTAGAVA